jgi:hypothetical protein
MEPSFWAKKKGPLSKALDLVLVQVATVLIRFGDQGDHSFLRGDIASDALGRSGPSSGLVYVPGYPVDEGFNRSSIFTSDNLVIDATG